MENQKNYERRPGSGVAFKNTRKERENQPDYTGTIKQLDGTEVRVAMWERDGRFSIQLSEFMERREESREAQQSRNSGVAVQQPRSGGNVFAGGDDEDLPF